MPIRTYLDAGVLITAFRGRGASAQAAREILDDPNRQFVASDILRLELIPKARFHRQRAEAEFYEAFFASASTMLSTTPDVVRDAETIAEQHGLAAADALHVTAAQRANAAELITTEHESKPLFRAAAINVLSLTRF